MRERVPYSKKSDWASPQGYGLRVDEPVAGFYKMRLRSGGVFVGVELRYGPPLDPVTGEEMDRSWRWLAFANGEPVDLDRVWPMCARIPITEAAYCAYVKRTAWARQNAPQSAYAAPGRKIDLLSPATPRFF